MTRFIRTISKIILKIISFKSHEHLLQEFRIITGLQTSVLAIFFFRKWRSALDAQAFGLWADDRSNSCFSNTLADVKVEGQSSKKMAALSCPPRQRMFSDNWWQWGISLMFHLMAARNLFHLKMRYLCCRLNNEKENKWIYIQKEWKKGEMIKERRHKSDRKNKKQEWTICIRPLFPFRKSSPKRRLRKLDVGRSR